MKKEKLYLVMSCKGGWDDYFEYAIFATKDKEYAETYIEKLKILITKIREEVEPFVEQRGSIRHIKEEYYDSWQYKWWESVEDLGEPFIREVELR